MTRSNSFRNKNRRFVRENTDTMPDIIDIEVDGQHDELNNSQTNALLNAEQDRVELLLQQVYSSP